MLIKTYKTTIKRILRSPLFWMALAVVAVLIFMEFQTGIYESEKNDDFVLEYYKYYESIANLLRSMMLYLIPCLCVVAVITVIAGDYTDYFFEIEKSGGISSITYFFGRLLGILTVLFTITAIFSFVGYHYYFFTRGGTANFTGFKQDAIEPWAIHSLKEYIFNSTDRLLRAVLLCQFPVVILFTTVTYTIGVLLESGILSGIGGSIGVVSAYLAAIRYQWAFDSIVYKYFLPANYGAYSYLLMYDTVFGSDKYTMPNGLNRFLNSTREEVIAWIAVMLGISLLCIIVSYTMTHRRKI